MTAAAFKATYAEWRVIKTRATVQIVFEMPVEKADEAYQALGGMPIAAREVWCAIARMGKEVQTPVADSSPTLPPSPTVSRNTAGEAERVKSQGEIAGYFCTLPSFWKFLEDKFPAAWEANNVIGRALKTNIAKECIYDLCAVKSRADLSEKNTDWMGLRLAFGIWQRHPELEDA